MHDNDIDSTERQRASKGERSRNWSRPRGHSRSLRKRGTAGLGLESRGWIIAASPIVIILTVLISSPLFSQVQSFVPTGNLITGRNGHRAITLNDGTVLIVGGYDVNENALASSELYNPMTGTFTATGSLSVARRNFGITLLDNGMVLVTGGFDANFNALASAEIYDPATGIFSLTGSLATARRDATATRLNDGTVLIAGGFDAPGNSLATAQVYVPSSGTFVPTGNLNAARGLSTATRLMDGRVLIVGGWAAAAALSSAEVYDPATGRFTITGSLNVARLRNTATLLNGGGVLIVGGEDSASNALANAEIYNPTTGAFTVTGSLNTARGDHAATLLTNGTVLVEGGFACDPANCIPTAVDMSASAEIYDPVVGSFSATGSLATARQVHTATLLPNGTVLAAGGWSGTNSALTSTEIYQPASFAPPNLVAISISPSNPSIVVGGSQQLVPIGTFNDSSTQVLASVIWRSSNIASVEVTNNTGSNSGMLNDSTNNGVVFGLSAGTSTVSACAGTICGSTTVTVASGGSNQGFALMGSPASQTVSPGGAATFSLQLLRTIGFSGNVVLSCIGMPVGATCKISPALLMAGGTNSATVTVTTSGPSAALANSSRGTNFTSRAQAGARGVLILGSAIISFLTLSVGLCFVPSLKKTGTRWLLVLLLSELMACGGPISGGVGTAPGNYAITVAGKAGGMSSTAQLILIVK